MMTRKQPAGTGTKAAPAPKRKRDPIGSDSEDGDYSVKSTRSARKPPKAGAQQRGGKRPPVTKSKTAVKKGKRKNSYISDDDEDEDADDDDVDEEEGYSDDEPHNFRSEDSRHSDGGS